jgi:hypothetical protein
LTGETRITAYTDIEHTSTRPTHSRRRPRSSIRSARAAMEPGKSRRAGARSTSTTARKAPGAIFRPMARLASFPASPPPVVYSRLFSPRIRSGSRAVASTRSRWA